MQSISFQLGGAIIFLYYSAQIYLSIIQRSYKASQLYFVIHYVKYYKLFWIYSKYILDIAWKLFINLQWGSNEQVLWRILHFIS